MEGGSPQQFVGVYCPTVLFPYLREAVSNAVERGSFPQFILTPVNFDALYSQAVQERAAGQNAVKH